MSPTEQLEIETKYDVDDTVILPALHELAGVASVAQPVELDLEAVYFDTAGLDLAANKVTLRRRTGGEDDGWHVKLPAAAEPPRGTPAGQLSCRWPPASGSSSATRSASR